jgi:hypothetical protein
MSTEISDLEAICSALAEGRKIDPEIAKRVQSRSQELRKKFGSEVSVELVRSVREE